MDYTHAKVIKVFEREDHKATIEILERNDDLYVPGE